MRAPPTSEAKQTARHSVSLAWVPRDAWLIMAARGLRSFSLGACSIVLAEYLTLLGMSLAQVGLFLSAGMAGSALAMLGVVLLGDRFGRRRILVALSALMAAAAGVLVLTNHPVLLLAIAFFGSLNLGGGGGGPIEPMEQSSLAGASTSNRRTDLYAIYGLIAMGASALGALAGGLPSLYQRLGLAQLDSYRVVILTLSLFAFGGAVLYAFLSRQVESSENGSRWTNPLKLRARRTIFTLAALFSVDHLAGTFVVQSLAAHWFITKFGMSLEVVGLIFFWSNILAAGSLWVSSQLSKKIGLINTMVFTHIPANLLLLSVPFLPNGWLAGTAWVLRGFLSMMDVPTRQSYTMAVVPPDERSAMAGLTSLPRSAVGAVGPWIAGTVAGLGLVSLPFIACGVLKIGYDLTLFGLFRKVRPPEET